LDRRLAPIKDLAGDFGAGFDPCAALKAGSHENEITFEREKVPRQRRHKDHSVDDSMDPEEFTAVATTYL
jgi:hypothetical protein